MGPTKVCTLNSGGDDRSCVRKEEAEQRINVQGHFPLKKWYRIQYGEVQLSRETRDGTVTNVKDSEETVTESMENGKALHFYE